MKDLLITLGLSLTLLAGCASQEMPEVPALDSNLTTVKSGKMLAIERYIDRNHKSITRGEETPLLPYVVNGDTVMYVANYPGGGFEIFSNDLALPMVLVKSTTGEYNPYGNLVKTPFDDFLAEAGEIIAENQNLDNSLAPNISWSVYSNREEEGGGEGGEGMVYVGTGCEIENFEYTPKGGRLATKWNQRYPFNQYIPFFADGSGEHSFVGCGAVAVGQYLFHYHKYFNKPVTTVTNGTYNASSNTYTFSGKSSSIWNSFINNSDNAEAAKQTAIFLGYVAQQIYTTFSEYPDKGSTSYRGDYASFINSECNTQYGWSQFVISDVIKILEAGHPVLSDTRLDKFENNGKITYNTGHAYVIDYASNVQIAYYDVYAQKPDDNIDDEDFGDEISGYGPSLNYFYKRYGSISTSFAGVDNEYWVKINWGWGGKHDDLLLNAELTNWSIYREDDTMKLYRRLILK